MKKFLTLAVCLALVCGCTSNRKFSGTGIPEQVKTIEFYNGGTCIGRYEDAKVELRSVHSEGFTGQAISFYLYVVSTKDSTEYIVDSEALAIKYTLYNNQEYKQSMFQFGNKVN